MALEEQFIQHLSKEIETLTTAMITFRTKIAFTIFLGPFVLLATFMVGTKSVPQVGQLSTETVLALITVGLCYLLLSLLSARIELGMWKQCNHWRAQVAVMVDREDVDPMSESVQVSPRRLLLTYGLAFTLFFLSLIIMIILISSLFGSQSVGPMP